MPLKKPLKLNDFHSTQNVTQERCKAENKGSDRLLVDDAVNISTVQTHAETLTTHSISRIISDGNHSSFLTIRISDAF